MAQNGTDMRRDVVWPGDGGGGKEDVAGAGAGDDWIGGAASGKEIVNDLLHFGHLADFPSALTGTVNDAPQWVQLARFFSVVSPISSSTDAGSRAASEN